MMLLAFALYFCTLLIIGLIAHKKSQSELDFAVGGRSLNFWLTALSAHASDMSAWLFISLPALIFLEGATGSWIALGLLMGMFISWQWIAPRLRLMTEKYDVYTLSSLFDRHYGSYSHWIRLATALLTLVFMTHYLTAGLMAVGIVLESSFHFPYTLGVVLATVLMITYTYIGGFVTVAWTDFCQAIFLMGVILIVPLVGYLNLSSPDAITIAAQTRELPLNPFANLTPLWTFQMLLTAFGWSLGYLGVPHVLTKFLGIAKPEELRKSKYIGLTWQVIVLGGAIAIGTVAIGMYSGRSIDPQLLFIDMVGELFPAFLAGLFLCGILAANISTMDSQILVCATVLTEDIYGTLFPAERNSSQLVRITRWGVILTSVIACFLSLEKNATIQETVAYSWAGLGCTLGPVVLATLFMPSSNGQGIIAGIIVGGFVAAFWPELSPLFLETKLIATIPGFLLAIPTILIVSRLTADGNGHAGDRNRPIH